jgi:hypothetical protein
MQVELATDVLFHRQAELHPLYDRASKIARIATRSPCASKGSGRRPEMLSFELSLHIDHNMPRLVENPPNFELGYWLHIDTKEEDQKLALQTDLEWLLSIRNIDDPKDAGRRAPRGHSLRSGWNRSNRPRTRFPRVA